MDYINTYLNGVKTLIDEVNPEHVTALVDALQEAWANDRRVLFMGNGGSAGTASHIVNDLQKCIQCEAGKPIKALCLSDNTALVLAWGNDTEFANIYAPQVECWVQPGDVVIGISGSGNSPNVLNAIEAGNRLEAQTWGLAGYGGGKLATLARRSIVVNSRNMQQIEDLHMVILHLVFSMLRDRIKS